MFLQAKQANRKSNSQGFQKLGRIPVCGTLLRTASKDQLNCLANSESFTHTLKSLFGALSVACAEMGYQTLLVVKALYHIQPYTKSPSSIIKLTGTSPGEVDFYICQESWFPLLCFYQSWPL